MRRTLLPLVVGALLMTSSALAQPRATFSTVRFSPAMGPGNYLALDGARVLPRSQHAYGLLLDYANETLAVGDPCRSLDGARYCSSGERVFLRHTGLAHLMLAAGLPFDTQLALDLPLGVTDGAGLPYEIAAGTQNPFREVKPRDGFVLSDLRVTAKRPLYRGLGDTLHVAAAAFATLPTGLLTSDRDCRRADTCTFVGERGMQVGAHGIAEYAPIRSLRVAANVGLTYRPQRNFLGAETGSELALGVGAAYEPIAYLIAKAECAMALELAGVDDTPLEARAGLAYGRDLVMTLGAGAGIVGDVGSPRYRLFGGLQWTPTVHDADRDRIDDHRDKCPSTPEDRDGFQDGDGCPDPDDDRDGIPDAADGCDREPEDRDGFQDDDGCADPDNDGDGVPDGYDTCEGAKEDVDGDHDDDGCPDLDGDRDGVPDGTDRCPAEAEDTDALGDEDGCPETDHDGDRVLDTDDACPEQAAPKRRLPNVAPGCAK